MQTTANAESILKEFYVAPVQEQLNSEIMALQMFEEETVEWQGKVAIVPVHIARNAGTGMRAEGQPLPTATNQTYERLEVPARFGYGRFAFTGPSLEFSDTEKGSFEPVMTSEMKRLVEDVRVMFDKQCFTGGQIIGLVWQKQNNTAWQYSGRVDNTLDTNWGVEIGVGETVRLVSCRTQNFVGAATQVNSITESTLTVNANINAAVGVADSGGILIEAGDVFAVLHGNANRLVEFSGILDNLANPQFFNINRVLAANAQLRSNYLCADFTAAAPVYQDLSLDALQILLDKILLTSNGQPDGMLMNPVHRQSYTTLLQGTAAGVPTALRQDNSGGAKKKGDGGFTSIGYADIPFRTAQHAPKGSIYMIARKYWSVFQRKPGDFAQADGKILNKVPNFDAYEGFWKQYLNVVAKRPNGNGILTGVSYFGV